ncbi:LacI family DNA-binding transcriptional regulator [Paenibacillus daejeonensis]|uniref:LacI family DNA-binding transcriptional regulator n=1 Tax=Paenibacillus daejeonensis TaxID=135193 RepID=UPI00037E086C|nr:LacI family DNA-binding transcriptional regulator [Paenibacillus daejeonensis]
MNKVTLQMIADRLNVSKALVSKALSGDSAVNEGTKETIWKTAEEMGYRFKKPKPSSAEVHSGMMAVLMPRAYLDDMEYWGNVIQGIEKELLKHNFSMLLSSIDISLPPKEGLLSAIEDHKVNGAIVMGHLPNNYIDALKEKHFPFIILDANMHDPTLDHVLANNYLGAYEASIYLMEQGHRNLAFVGDPDTSWSFKERYRGFREAVMDYAKRCGEPVWAKLIGGVGVSGTGMYTHPELDQGIRDSVTQNSPITAMFCANDLTAFETLKRLNELGKQCPDDVSIVGFDDTTLAKLLRPNLTTVKVPKTAIGGRAAELILRRIRYPEVAPGLVMLSTELVTRDSVRTIPADVPAAE